MNHFVGSVEHLLHLMREHNRQVAERRRLRRQEELLAVREILRFDERGADAYRTRIEELDDRYQRWATRCR